jgi:heptaprenyl diphosphate synthase
MLHVATLIHDDIVDRATVRRGLPSVNASRGTQVAVLVGDLQFIQAVRCFAHAVETERDMHLVRLILDAGFKICCGELDEIRTDPDWRPDLLRARYLRTVDRKTGVLFGLACESGGYLMVAGSRATYVLGRFGRCFGRAFQIMDDLLDFVRTEEDSGKPQAIDLAQGCLSLPILYALDELPPEHPLHRIVRGQPHTEDELKATIADVVLTSGFLRAYSDARESILRGLSYLGHFPASQYRDALSRLAWYVVDREIAPPAQHPTGG